MLQQLLSRLNCAIGTCICLTVYHNPLVFQWTYFPFQQIVSQDVWLNEYIMEEVRRIADETTAQLDGGKCFVYSLFHIFTEVIRVCILT